MFEPLTTMTDPINTRKEAKRDHIRSPGPRKDNPTDPSSTGKSLDKEDFPGGKRPSQRQGQTSVRQDQQGENCQRTPRAELHEKPEKAHRPYRAKDPQKKVMQQD